MIAVFNGLILSDYPFTITGYGGYNAPRRDIKSVDLARSDGSIQVAERYGSRTIPLEGTIKTGSKAELIAAIDLLKQYTYRADGNLVVTDDDEIERTWRCTVQNLTIVRARGGATQASFSIEFFAPQPYSSAQTVTLADTNITTQPINLPITIAGTYPASPYITLTINSITGGEQTITIGNQANARSMDITSVFTAGDVITIDTDKRDVYINTERSDYGGTFPQWDVGAGSVSYVDTASARDVDIVMTATVRNL